MARKPGGLKDGADALDNDERVRILGIIDRFRELGVNEDIALPQLVVVGDQSSGKSSLLEGLTGLSFPIASELCTRFATQIILRRTPIEDSSVKVSILPGPAAAQDEQQKERLQGFLKTTEGDDLRSEDFVEILDEAAELMGLPAMGERDVENLEKRFSDDVLRIELSGPQHHHLSVVDVPGLFHNPTKYQTKDDLAIIRALIEKYITDRRTIILAVMDARNNLANQEVFRMARSADPQGLRTVGIITKCDAVQPGDEDGVLRIASNSVERLNHGWFAVKNRSTQEIADLVSIEERHHRERLFFSTSPWSTLPKDRVGVKPLRIFLGKLLYNHIRGEFPSLVSEIRSHVIASRKELDGLGPSRQSVIEQRRFLSRLAASYGRGVNDSLSGNYDSNWQANDARKLRMHIQHANEEFSIMMAKKGHTRAFRTVDDLPDEEFLTEQRESEESIHEWIRIQYRESRGSELPGTVNPAVLESMFRQQTQAWEDLAWYHVRRVEQIINQFNNAIFEEIVPEESLRRKIQARNDTSSTSASRLGSSQLESILKDERGGILQTVNHYYANTLSSIREERVLHRFQALGLRDGLFDIDLQQLCSVAHLSNEQQAIFDIHDVLKAYYKVAQKRFTDNVVMQVVERCFLGDDGSVKSICPEYIGTLDDQELTDLAAESYAVSCVRNDTALRLARMEEALAIAETARL